jgi:hypothetical protein
MSYNEHINTSNDSALLFLALSCSHRWIDPVRKACAQLVTIFQQDELLILACCSAGLYTLDCHL